MQPAIAILFACARKDLAAASQTRLLDLLSTGADWDSLLRAGEHHGLLPLLNWHLRSLPTPLLAQAVPDAALARLRGYVYQNGVDYLQAATQLTRVVRHFAMRKVPVLAFKGVTLAVRLYSNAALRQPGDLDNLNSG